MANDESTKDEGSCLIAEGFTEHWEHVEKSGLGKLADLLSRTERAVESLNCRCKTIEKELELCKKERLRLVASNERLRSLVADRLSEVSK